MKFFLTIIFILFYVNCISASGATGVREMNKEDQHILLMNAINWDRKLVGDMLNIKMETMEYDGLKEEYIIWTEECQKVSTEMSNTSMILSGDENGRKFLETYQTTAALFFPSFTTIGCSKDFICTYTIPKDLDDEELAGKTVEFYGVCVLENYWTISDEDYLKLINLWLTKPWKYGDIIGVPGPVDNSAAKDSGIPAGGGLNADEQKKLLDAINKDRKEFSQKVKVNISPLTYDVAIEKSINKSEECSEFPLMERSEFLSGDNSSWEKLTIGRYHSLFLAPSSRTLGCSKTFTCKMNTPTSYKELYGVCIFGESFMLPYVREFEKEEAAIPSNMKYGKVLGIRGAWDDVIEEPKTTEVAGLVEVEGSGMDGADGKQESGVKMPDKDGADEKQGSGAESVFSLIISLFMVFYI